MVEIRGISIEWGGIFLELKNEIKRGNLDKEWVVLILMAKEIGIRPDDIRNFIKKNEKTKMIGRKTSKFIC